MANGKYANVQMAILKTSNKDSKMMLDDNKLIILL